MPGLLPRVAAGAERGEIFDGPTTPIIRPPETAPHTYVKQLLASPPPALDSVVARGVTDRDGIGGHNYGAFMTANLLARSHIFQMRITRSGAYNPSLTPSGSRRAPHPAGEAADIYPAMSRSSTPSSPPSRPCSFRQRPTTTTAGCSRNQRPHVEIMSPLAGAPSGAYHRADLDL